MDEQWTWRSEPHGEIWWGPFASYEEALRDAKLSHFPEVCLAPCNAAASHQDIIPDLTRAKFVKLRSQT